MAREKLMTLLALFPTRNNEMRKKAVKFQLASVTMTPSAWKQIAESAKSAKKRAEKLFR